MIVDLDQDGDLEVVVPSSCNPTTFCINGKTGLLEWSIPSHGSDSPPTIANMDQEPNLEILHCEFGGWVLGINAENGSQAFNIPVDLNSWIQTAPAILDVNQDNQLDFIVATWSFDTAHTIYAYDGANQQLLWQSSAPNDYIYHGGAFADIDGDLKPEIAFADYSGQVMVLNAEGGSIAWTYTQPNPFYAGAPISISDINGDGRLNLVYLDGWTVVALNNQGQKEWEYVVPNGGQAFRGSALADVNNDSILDVTIGTSTGKVISLNGLNGNVVHTIDLQAHYGGNDLDIDHGPLIADFNQDGSLDVFVVGGHAEYPDIQNNYGRAYMATLGPGNGPEWLMFRHDERRSACACHKAPNHLDEQEAVENVEFDIYPNPVLSMTTLTCPQNWVGRSIQVFESNGQLIENLTIEAQTQTFDLTNYPSGSYHLTLPFGNTLSLVKID